MDTFYAFLLALIVFYILMEWRLGKARRESERRYADLEAKTRWLYKMLDELQAAPPKPAEVPVAEAAPAADTPVAPQAEALNSGGPCGRADAATAASRAHRCCGSAAPA